MRGRVTERRRMVELGRVVRKVVTVEVSLGVSYISLFQTGLVDITTSPSA